MALSADQEEDFRRFVQANWQSLVRTAYLLTGDHGRAEDLVQQTLVACHRRWGALRAQSSPYAYVRAALTNQSISANRRKRVAETLFGGPGRDEHAGVPAGFDEERQDRYASVDNRDALARALRTLPPRMRAVIVLRYFDDLSEAATADALGISVGSVKSQTSRGLDKLHAALQTTDQHTRPEGSLR